MALHPFFSFFYENRPFIDPDPSQWPEEWRKVFYKSYPRLEKIKLPEPRPLTVNLQEVLLERESRREFQDAPLELHDLSNLLFYSAGSIAKGSSEGRVYPSGGARYPLEIYVAVLKGKVGLFHYHVQEHALERLLDKEVERLRTENAFHYEWVNHAAAIIILSAVHQRSKAKYGNLAFKLEMLEAGHIGQNIYLVSQALGLKCCALGSFEPQVVHQVLDIDGVTETAFYALAVGK